MSLTIAGGHSDWNVPTEEVKALFLPNAVPHLEHEVKARLFQDTALGNIEIIPLAFRHEAVAGRHINCLVIAGENLASSKSSKEGYVSIFIGLEANAVPKVTNVTPA